MNLICNACQGDRPPIHGDGPYPATIMAIGENPGWDEWFRTRKPFTGKSGRELNERIFPIMGLHRPEVQTLNAYRCFKPRGVSPTPAEARTCADHWLHTDLMKCRPYVVLAFGAISWSLFDSNLPISVVSGIPAIRSFGSWTGYVIPIMHPAAGMRKSDMMIQILEDARKIHEDRLLDACITNTYTAPQDPYPNVDYQEITDLQEQDEYWQQYADSHAGLDTESDTSIHQRLVTAPPWCLTYSLAPGTGRLIRAGNGTVLRDLEERLRRYRLLVCMHNALHDINVSRRMRVEFERDRVVDTMLRANSIQTLPKGLKALSFRLLHMTMRDFNDVTLGPSNDQALYYLRSFVEQQESRYQYVHTFKSGARKGQTEPRWRDRPEHLGPAVTQANNAIKTYGQSAVQLLDPSYHEVEGDSDAETDAAQPVNTIWDRWDGWRPEVQQAIVGAMAGMPFPLKSITWPAFPDALQYAVRDADATWRLYPELRRRMFGVGRPVPIGA